MISRVDYHGCHCWVLSHDDGHQMRSTYPCHGECVPIELSVGQGIWAFWSVLQQTGYFPTRVPWIQGLELNRMGTSLSEVSRGVIKQIGGISTLLPPSKNEGSTVMLPVCGSWPRPVWD